MRTTYGAVLLLAALAAVSCQRPGVQIDEARIIDLTYSFDEATIYWPADQHFQRQQTSAGVTPGGYWYSSGVYGASEHGGTHMDSPIHFAEGGQSMDQIPVSRFVGPAIVVDIAGACSKDRDYELSVADLEAWEGKHGRIPGGCILLVHTGWGKYWPDKKRYLGSDTPGDTANLHFPGISEAAARFLATERNIDGVGLDTASLDHGPSERFLAHQILTGANIIGLENVANLEKLPATGATLIALPMKIKGGSGAPARVIALLPPLD